MSETNETVQPDETPQGVTEETQVSEVAEPDQDWKALARKWEAQAKRDKENALKWLEYEASQKTVEEKRAEELATLQQELATERTTRLRLEIAAERGITGEALQLLDGSSREEIEAKADALVALISENSKPKTPAVDPNQGRTATGGSSTAEQFANALSSIL